MKWWVWLTVFLAVPLAFNMPFFGMLVDPWTPFRLSGHAGTTITGPSGVPIPVTVDPGEIGGHGFVSDAQRFVLARAAGWPIDEAITATAISIAEDGSGDPAALSGVNFNGSRDLGLWQINSGWWARFGGQSALIDPITNARAGNAIYHLQGWCAWSTFDTNCPGGGHTGAYRAFMDRARRASQNQTPAGQA